MGGAQLRSPKCEKIPDSLYRKNIFELPIMDSEKGKAETNSEGSLFKTDRDSWNSLYHLFILWSIVDGNRA